jgi:ATP-dependent Clp protease ATP-binding subunit ClpX
LKAIVSKAIEKKTGARGLRSIIEHLLLDAMFGIPDKPNAVEITIDANTVKGKTAPIVVYNENAA